jgi:hypothetical protein
MVEFILSRLAEPPCMVDNLPKIPGLFQDCLRKKKYHVTEALIQAGFKCDIKIHEAIIAGDAGLVKYLHSQGSDLTSRSLGLTPIEVAVMEGEVGILVWLLDSINEPDVMVYKHLPHLAVTHHRIQIINVLHSKKIPLDEFDGEHLTPLMVAAQYVSADMILKLVECGVSTLKNRAISYAASESIVQLLAFLMARESRGLNGYYDRSIFKFGGQILSEESLKNFVFRQLEEAIAMCDSVILQNYYKYHNEASDEDCNDDIMKLLILSSDEPPTAECFRVIYWESGILSKEEKKSRIPPLEFARRRHELSLVDNLVRNGEEWCESVM